MDNKKKKNCILHRVQYKLISNSTSSVAYWHSAPFFQSIKKLIGKRGNIRTTSCVNPQASAYLMLQHIKSGNQQMKLRLIIF